ncbi:caca0db9-e1ac-496e-92ec-a5559c829b5d [Sclerotinia trifoliorum]|uniref:Caca0db9-e1ac-496e-92ec-a5559c829b5d n=1 Tax=Sclerotinia trifoliorum TaxID=28548 RepID=A0A8H2ZSQ1_9HELO|nr:caca0db9-e1ac-496e-92ec-a5559c829b5d [Sclerotinia trifoliorum]
MPSRRFGRPAMVVATLIAFSVLTLVFIGEGLKAFVHRDGVSLGKRDITFGLNWQTTIFTPSTGRSEISALNYCSPDPLNTPIPLIINDIQSENVAAEKGSTTVSAILAQGTNTVSFAVQGRSDMVSVILANINSLVTHPTGVSNTARDATGLLAIAMAKSKPSIPSMAISSTATPTDLHSLAAFELLRKAVAYNSHHDPHGESCDCSACVSSIPITIAPPLPTHELMARAFLARAETVTVTVSACPDSASTPSNSTGSGPQSPASAPESPNSTSSGPQSPSSASNSTSSGPKNPASENPNATSPSRPNPPFSNGTETGSGGAPAGSGSAGSSSGGSGAGGSNAGGSNAGGSNAGGSGSGGSGSGGSGSGGSGSGGSGSGGSGSGGSNAGGSGSGGSGSGGSNAGGSGSGGSGSGGSNSGGSGAGSAASASGAVASAASLFSGNSTQPTGNAQPSNNANKPSSTSKSKPAENTPPVSSSSISPPIASQASAASSGIDKSIFTLITPALSNVFYIFSTIAPVAGMVIMGQIWLL